MPNRLLLAFAKNTRLLNWCDLCLSILCGINHAIFNLAIGHYITEAVVYDPLEDSFLKRFLLLQCVVQLLSIGAAAPMLSFLQYVSLKDNSSLPDKFDESTVVYKRKLAMFIRDLAFLASSVLIAFSCSWQLSCPIMLMPILVLSWTTFFNQKKMIHRALLLSGPMCFVFFSMSIGGMYGSVLVDMKMLLEPGRIFTIAAGIGSSSFQFSTSKAQLWAHISSVPEKVISEVKNVDDIRTNEVAIAQTKDKENQVSHSEMLFAISRIIQLTIVHNPLVYSFGFVACVFHSFGWPVFTRLTGMFFDVFELRQHASNLTREEQYSFYSSNAAYICMAYAIMGLVVFFSVLTTGVIFARLGFTLVERLRYMAFNAQHKAEDLENYLDELTSAPKLSNLFVYGALCMSLSITSSLMNNRWMGSVCVVVFSLQILFQFWLTKFCSSFKYGQALAFASTNGFQQLNQAICYASGFILVQNGLVGALAVFKIIQTMHLGSVGMTSNILLRSDFYKLATSVVPCLVDFRIFFGILLNPLRGFNKIGNDGKRYVRRPVNKWFDPNYTKGTVKFGGGNIMVWGCFSWDGLGPFRLVDGKIDRFQYCQILLETMLGHMEQLEADHPNTNLIFLVEISTYFDWHWILHALIDLPNAHLSRLHMLGDFFEAPFVIGVM